MKAERVVVERRLLGRPTLGLRHAIGQALAIGPIASIFLSGYLLAAHGGPVAPLVTVAATAGALCLGWSIAQYGRRYAGAGALYEYGAQRFGKAAGTAIAGAYGLGALVATGLTVLAISLLGQGFAATHLGFEPPWWAAGALAALGAAYLQYRGIRLAIGFQLTVTALAALPLVVVAAAVMIQGAGEGAHTLAVFDPTQGSASDIFRALLFSLFLFGGFESAAALGEESRAPREAIPRGMVRTLVIVGVFYLVIMYAASIGFGPQEISGRWGTNPFALAELGDRFLGSPWSALMELGLLIDLVVILVAAGNAFARLIFAFGRDRLIPRRAAQVSRYETPSVGIAVVLISGLAMLLVASPLEDRTQMLEILFVGLGIILSLVFIILALGAASFVGRSPVLWLVVLIGAAFPALGLYGTVVPFPAGRARIGLWLGGAILAVVGAWIWFLLTRRASRLRDAAAYAPLVGTEKAEEVV